MEKRRKIDWDAIQRDYRTGHFTLRELEAKYEVNNATIARKIKRDGWQQDLSEAVRQATNAKLISEMVSSEVSKGQQEISNTVLAAAEVNKQVILGHRSDIASTRDVAAGLLRELNDTRLLASEQALLAEILAGGEAADEDQLNRARQVVRKALDFGNRINGVKSLAETFSKLQGMERTAFGLDDDANKKREGLSIEDFIEAAGGKSDT